LDGDGVEDIAVGATEGFGSGGAVFIFVYGSRWNSRFHCGDI